MKIATVLAIAVVLAAGCDSNDPAPVEGARVSLTAASPPCAAPVTREVALTGSGAKDLLDAQIVGPDCEKGALVLTLRKADGALLWAYSVRATDTWAFVPASDGVPVDPPRAMATFIQEVFKNARIEKTGEAPDWPEGGERPEDPTGLYHVTPLPREAYLILRTKNVPMLCVQAEMGTSHCISYDSEFGDVANEFYASSS